MCDSIVQGEKGGSARLDSAEQERLRVLGSMLSALLPSKRDESNMNPYAGPPV
jgi:hypothetical protein